jgi:hypothetical protein
MCVRFIQDLQSNTASFIVFHDIKDPFKQSPAMTQARSYAALSATAPLAPFTFERRARTQMIDRTHRFFCAIYCK